MISDGENLIGIEVTSIIYCSKRNNKRLYEKPRINLLFKQLLKLILFYNF